MSLIVAFFHMFAYVFVVHVRLRFLCVCLLVFFVVMFGWFHRACWLGVFRAGLLKVFLRILACALHVHIRQCSLLVFCMSWLLLLFRVFAFSLLAYVFLRSCRACSLAVVLRIFTCGFVVYVAWAKCDCFVLWMCISQINVESTFSVHPTETKV